MSLAEVLPMALQLSQEERAALAEEMLRSLEPDQPDPGYQAAWDAELQARMDQVEQGTCVLIPWREAIESIGNRCDEVHVNDCPLPRGSAGGSSRSCPAV